MIAASLACGRHARPEPAAQDTQLTTEQAKATAHAFLDRRAAETGSSETSTFEKLREVGDEWLLELRAHHPEFFLLYHSLITVAYDPPTRRFRFVSR